MDRYVDGCVESDGIACQCGCLDRRTSGWVGGCLGGWNKEMVGLMAGCVDGQVGVWLDILGVGIKIRHTS